MGQNSFKHLFADYNKRKILGTFRHPGCANPILGVEKKATSGKRKGPSRAEGRGGGISGNALDFESPMFSKTGDFQPYRSKEFQKLL